LPVRLIALRKSEEAAAQARIKALQKASRRGKAVDVKVVVACGGLMLRCVGCCWCRPFSG
jgi:formiminotetrahydrofolate cyclodeaminase